MAAQRVKTETRAADLGWVLLSFSIQKTVFVEWVLDGYRMDSQRDIQFDLGKKPLEFAGMSPIVIMYYR